MSNMDEDFSADPCWQRRVLWQWLTQEGFTPMRRRTGGAASGYYSARDGSVEYDGQVRYYGGAVRLVHAKLQPVADRFDALGVPYAWRTGDHGYEYLAVSVRHVAALLPAEPVAERAEHGCKDAPTCILRANGHRGHLTRGQAVVFIPAGHHSARQVAQEGGYPEPR